MGADHYEASEQEYADYLFLVPHSLASILKNPLFAVNTCSHTLDGYTLRTDTARRLLTRDLRIAEVAREHPRCRAGLGFSRTMWSRERGGNHLNLSPQAGRGSLGGRSRGASHNAAETCALASPSGACRSVLPNSLERRTTHDLRNHPCGCDAGLSQLCSTRNLAVAVSSQAAKPRELVALTLPEGSYAIERYEHDHGVQWLVQHVKDGQVWTRMVFDTKREAARFVAAVR